MGPSMSKRRGAKGGGRGAAPRLQKGKKVESVNLSLLLISNFSNSLLNRSSKDLRKGSSEHQNQPYPEARLKSGPGTLLLYLRGVSMGCDLGEKSATNVEDLDFNKFALNKFAHDDCVDS